MTTATLRDLLAAWHTAGTAARASLSTSPGGWDACAKLYAEVRQALAEHGPVEWQGQRWSCDGRRMWVGPALPAKVAGVPVSMRDGP